MKTYETQVWWAHHHARPAVGAGVSSRSPTGAVDWFRAFREIEMRLMDLASRTQCSVQEHRADAARAWRTNEHDWAAHLGLVTGVGDALAAPLELPRPHRGRDTWGSP